MLNVTTKGYPIFNLPIHGYTDNYVIYIIIINEYMYLKNVFFYLSYLFRLIKYSNWDVPRLETFRVPEVED